MFTIRNAILRDLDAVAAVEAVCFSPAEAATREMLADRLRHYPNHFWLLFDDETLVSFVDGCCGDGFLKRILHQRIDNIALLVEMIGYARRWSIGTAFRTLKYSINSLLWRLRVSAMHTTLQDQIPGEFTQAS